MNRIMRLTNNPNARGFLVRVLENTGRDKLGNLHFKVIASATAGTRSAADRKYDELRAEYITN
tara:strand:+ start:2786 stop:2974 length:189 start_codon:yes stop_codon:yes gene_type:complete